jgi:capsular exopolysaccharide synthesis family protein
MSQIFDALQRSDAERSGDPASEQLQPTDVLRRAERFEATRWQKDGTPGRSAESQGFLDDSSAFETLDPALLAAAGIATATAETQNLDLRSSVFSQFQTADVSVTSQSRLVCLTQIDSAAAEAFRLLGVRVRDIRRTRALKKLLITSSIPQEGKSMVAANLAITIARAKQRVLIIEGDVRRPGLSQAFGLQGETGLCEWLYGEKDLTSSIYRLDGPGLWVMPAGRSPQNPLELLQSAKLTALIGQVSEWFDTVVIDSPPMLPLADTSIWMRLADGILLVTRQGTTEKRQLQRTLEAIDPNKLIGALLNCSRSSLHSDYYYRPSNLNG